MLSMMSFQGPSLQMEYSHLQILISFYCTGGHVLHIIFLFQITPFHLS